METILLTADKIDLAAEFLKHAEPVAIPTETVYGLAATIFNRPAIEKIFTLKSRPADNPLIAHVATFDMVDRIAQQIPPAFYTLARAFWPGPLSFVLAKREEVPSSVTAGLDTVALRMPSHPVALRLIETVGEPLVAPSANLSGKPSPTCASHVLEDFAGKLVAILDGGPCTVGIESTVLSLTDETPILLRPGAISKDEIEQVLQQTIAVAGSKEQGMSPGMKYRHYAPKAAIHLVMDLPVFCDSASFILSREPTGVSVYRPLQAKCLYSFLREADRIYAGEIWVLLDPISLADEALMNRLRKAAGMI